MPDALARTQEELDAWKEEEVHWRSVNERQKTLDRIQKEEIPEVHSTLESARSEAASATQSYEKVRLILLVLGLDSSLTWVTTETQRRGSAQIRVV